MSSERLQSLKERGIDELRRFFVMFLYLWVVFGLFVLNESVILGGRNISFAPQGFALINAAVMAPSAAPSRMPMVNQRNSGQRTAPLRWCSSSELIEVKTMVAREVPTAR